MRRTTLVALPLLAVALVESGKDWATALAQGRPEPYLRVLLGSLEWWGLWALLGA